jgi:hypothetical protein
LLFIGLQEDGVNGGAITMDLFPAQTAYGTFYNTTNTGVHNPENIAVTPSVPLLSGNAIDASFIPGTLVVWMTVTGNLGANLRLGTQAFESSFTQNLLPWMDSAGGYFPRPRKRRVHYRHSAVEPPVHRL